jgi:hypothetical protein
MEDDNLPQSDLKTIQWPRHLNVVYEANDLDLYMYIHMYIIYIYIMTYISYLSRTCICILKYAYVCVKRCLMIAPLDH